jgi:hypothetical protein
MKTIQQVDKQTGEIMSQVITHPTGLNSDTGERNYASLSDAMNIVTHYLGEHMEVTTPRMLAEMIIKSSISRNARTSYSSTDLDNKADEVADNITNLVRGWFKTNESLIGVGKYNTQWFGLAINGDQSDLTADRVCIIEAPEGSVMRTKFGAFVMLRFKADGGSLINPRTKTETKFTYPTSTGADGRVWFTSDLMPAQCLDGIVTGFKRLEEAKFALNELSSALYTLKRASDEQNTADVPSEWEAELIKIDKAEKALETAKLVEPSF